MLFVCLFSVGLLFFLSFFLFVFVSFFRNSWSPHADIETELKPQLMLMLIETAGILLLILKNSWNPHADTEIEVMLISVMRQPTFKCFRPYHGSF